jgi:hypothetical protein
LAPSRFLTGGLPGKVNQHLTGSRAATWTVSQGELTRREIQMAASGVVQHESGAALDEDIADIPADPSLVGRILTATERRDRILRQVGPSLKLPNPA